MGGGVVGSEQGTMNSFAGLISKCLNGT